MISRGHTGRPRESRRVVVAAAALLVLLASLTAAPAAVAGKPTGEFAVFADCPLETAGVTECVYAKFTGGELVLHKRTIPIKNTIVLQGGLKVTEKEETFVGAADGNTLTKVPQTVPGGFPQEKFREFEPRELTATIELASPAAEAVAINRANLGAGTGTAVKLVTDVHLKNAYLGESCFIGSHTSPITLDLTTGATSPPPPNKSIKGSPGKQESKEEGTLIVYNGDSLVENAFSVPGAHGCGGIFEFLLNPLVNSEFGIPAAAGSNTAILSGTSEFATAEAVRKSE